MGIQLATTPPSPNVSFVTKNPSGANLHSLMHVVVVVDVVGVPRGIFATFMLSNRDLEPGSGNRIPRRQDAQPVGPLKSIRKAC